MRDIVLTLIVAGLLPFILKRPSVGILVWIWLGVMNPHRLTYGFAYNLPFSQVVAILTFVALLFSREKYKFPLTRTSFVLIAFVLWTCVTTVFALEPEAAYPMWVKFMKIEVMVLLALYVLHTKRHVQAMVWVLALSVAFYGTKGGLYTLTGGERVWGPAGSFIEDNNAIAVAIIMTIPLLRYLQSLMTRHWARWAFVGSMVLCGFAALGSQSRGALLAISAMLMFLWLKTRNKLMTGMLLALIVPVAIGFMPDKWTERMKSIQTFDEDGSAQGRLQAWTMTLNLTKEHPITGGGFEIWTDNLFARFGQGHSSRVAHSIYFSVLGEHGYVGLGLFLLLWLFVWKDASWIVSRVRKKEDWQWAGDLARLTQVSLIGYLVGGAFLQLAYWDFPYYLVVAMVITRVLLQKELGNSDRRGVEPSWSQQRVERGPAWAPAVSPGRMQPPVARPRESNR